jgi:protein-tyrosine phosphatase/arsenate reductase
MKLYPPLQNLVQQLESDFNSIPEKRKADLKVFAEKIKESIQQFSKAKVIVICTHNSRRSHLGQVWLRLAAEKYNLPIETFSGGTESTAFHPNMVAALKDAGFQVEEISSGENPRYQVKISEEDYNNEQLFSKVYSDEYNPQENFIAVMVCTEADGGCPFVAGSVARLALPYQDPKYADGSSEEKEAYQKTLKEIGSEMLFTASLV